MIEKSPPHNKKDLYSPSQDQIFSMSTKNNFYSTNAKTPETKIINMNFPLEKVIKPDNLSTIINHRERNVVPRSNSPVINFNNTTNSFKLENNIINSEKNNKNLENEKMRISPIQIKNTVKNCEKKDVMIVLANYNIVVVSLKKKSNFNSIVDSPNLTNKRDANFTSQSPNLENKKEKSPINLQPVSISNDDKKRLKNSTNIKNINVEYARKDYLKKDLTNNTFTQKNLTHIKDKILPENKKDPKKDYSKQAKSLTTTSKNIEELEDFIKSKENISEFACCTINNIFEIQEKIKTHCSNNKIFIKDVSFHLNRLEILNLSVQKKIS